MKDHSAIKWNVLLVHKTKMDEPQHNYTRGKEPDSYPPAIKEEYGSVYIKL